MANLIVTIISILLVGIAVVATIFYGGQAYQQGQYQAMAGGLINQMKQGYAAANAYIMDHPGTDPTVFGFNDLVNGKYLEVTPTTLGVSMGNSPYLNSCYSLSGYTAYMQMMLVANAGQPIVLFMAGLNDPIQSGCTVFHTPGYGFEDVRYIKHPIVQLCKAINNITGIPAGVTMAPSGLPYAMAGSVQTQVFNKGGYSYIMFPPYHSYCHLTATSGTNVNSVYFDITN